jgi:exopolysaccharide production protein ExoZ
MSFSVERRASHASVDLSARVVSAKAGDVTIAGQRDGRARIGSRPVSKLPTLQILRGFAASLVVVDHAIIRQSEWAEYPAIVTLAAQYSGVLGVAIFFVISGYIMIHTSEKEFGRPGAAATFLRKRVIRIVPLYWIATLLEISLRLPKGGTVAPEEVLTSFLFIPQPVGPGEYMRPLLGVGWTLNYEMLFYVIFAAALTFGRKEGLRVLFGVIVGLVLLGALVKSLMDTSAPNTVFSFWTDPIILLFAVGVLIGLNAGAIRRRISIDHPIEAALFLVALNVAFFLALFDSYPGPVSWEVGTWLVCAAIVSICTIQRQGSGGLMTAAGVRLGDSSYALYLFHFFAIVATEKAWWFFFAKNPSFLFVLAAYLVSVASAYAIHQLIEVNIDRLFVRGRRILLGSN